MPTEILHIANSDTCQCAGCLNAQTDHADSVTLEASLDPQAGGTFNNKPILTADQVAAHLNRTGASFTGNATAAPQRGDSDLTTINYGFFETRAQLQTNGYVYVVGSQGFGFSEFFNFATFSTAQRDAAREAMASWDDIVAVRFVETSASQADINFGNLASAPNTQAYAYLPNATLSSNPAINVQIRPIAGDVWISASQASNFRFDEGMYGIHTLVHEVGHAIGLSHPGAYNAGSGGPITYAVNAEYAQDTRAYSVMSYFEGFEISGTRHFDFNVSTTVYAATPLIHDIAAAQRIYGADMTTRTGDTVYGFNSNAGRDSYDFTKTPAPIMAIWDAGGTDTIDASGYATDQIIDLSPGSLSSIGGVTHATAPTLAQVNANRAAQNIGPVSQATYDANMAALLANPVVGRLTNNVGIAYGAWIENAIGGSGNDSLLGNSVDNVLTGNAGNDIIGAGAGNDTLDGGTGNDTMLGGIGNDLFLVDAAGDIVTELASEGTDTVSSAISYALGVNLENLTLTGTASAGTGNELDNVITGNGSDNTLSGLGGNDTLIGTGGNDLLDGGTGNDSMLGGSGNDRFIVDAVGDSVTELAGAGTDTVVSAIDYALGAHLENLVLTGSALLGTGNELDNVLTGNALGNRLNGGAGNDRLVGGDGVDYLTGGAGNDVFVAEINGAKVGSKGGPISLDVVLDFATGDKIDLSGLGAFNWGGHSAGNNPGDLTIRTFGNINAAENALGIDIDGIDGPSSYTGPVTMVLGNVDGGAPEFALALIGVSGVTQNDFVFASDFLF